MNIYYKITFITLLTVTLSLALGGKMKGDKGKIEKTPIFNAGTGKVEEVDKIYKTDAQWKEVLTPEHYRVTRLKGTEKPFTDACELPKEKGLYQCVCCGSIRREN